MTARTRLLPIALGSALVLAACGGGGATTAPAGTPGGGTPTGAASPGTGTDATPSAASSASTGGGGGSETVRVVLTGGPDAGTYTSSADPLCTHGLIGAGGWGVQYSTGDLTGDKDFTSLQVVHYPDGAPEEAMFQGVNLLTTVTIGPLLEGRTYEIELNEDADETKGEGSASVTESGSNATITVSGTTAEGVGIEATVNCPSVTRM